MCFFDDFIKLRCIAYERQSREKVDTVLRPAHHIIQDEIFSIMSHVMTSYRHMSTSHTCLPTSTSICKLSTSSFSDNKSENPTDRPVYPRNAVHPSPTFHRNFELRTLCTGVRLLSAFPISPWRRYDFPTAVSNHIACMSSSADPGSSPSFVKSDTVSWASLTCVDDQWDDVAGWVKFRVDFF